MANAQNVGERKLLLCASEHSLWLIRSDTNSAELIVLQWVYSEMLARTDENLMAFWESACVVCWYKIDEKHIRWCAFSWLDISLDQLIIFIFPWNSRPLLILISILFVTNNLPLELEWHSVFMYAFWRQGGQYLINIIDIYGSAYPLSVISLLETIAVMWTYGQFTDIRHIVFRWRHGYC